MVDVTIRSAFTSKGRRFNSIIRPSQPFNYKWLSLPLVFLTLRLFLSSIFRSFFLVVRDVTIQITILIVLIIWNIIIRISYSDYSKKGIKTLSLENKINWRIKFVITWYHINLITNFPNIIHLFPPKWYAHPYFPFKYRSSKLKD